MSYHEGTQERLIGIEQIGSSDMWRVQFEPVIAVHSLKRMLSFLSDSQRQYTALGQHTPRGIKSMYHALKRPGSFEDEAALLQFYEYAGELELYRCVDKRQLAEKSTFDMSDAELLLMGHTLKSVVEADTL